MHSINEDGQICVNLDDYNYLSESILFREKINYLIQKLQCPKEISNFSISILFKTGRRYYISNLYLWAIPYRTEGFYRGDVDHDLSLYNGKEFFIQRNVNYDFTQLPIINILESRYKLHTTFAMIRQCYECDLIIEAYNNQYITDPEKLYLKLRDQFELFVVNFLEEMKTEIASALPDYQHLDFFQNKEFRKKLITRQLNNNHSILTERELDCLYLISKGMGTKLVADKLFLSVETINTHTKSIRRKLSCNNITQAVVIALKNDLFQYNKYPNLGIR